MKVATEPALPRSTGPTRGHHPVLSVVLLMVVVGTIYVALSWSHRGPVVYADEAGYLGNARWLAGGTPWWMGNASSYGFGYSLLLVPVFALVRSPADIYHVVLFVNGLLCAGLAGLLYVLVRKLLHVATWVAVVSSAIACAYPALAVQSGVAWVEVTSMVGVALLVLTAWNLFRSPRYTTLVATAAVAVFLSAVHNRFAAVPFLLLILLGYLALKRRDLRAPALWTASGTVAALIIVHVVQDAVHSDRWNSTPAAGAVTLHSLIASLPGKFFTSFVGQIWYLLAATAGLIVFGVVAMVRAFLVNVNDERPRPHFQPLSTRWMLAFVLASLASVALVSIAYVGNGIGNPINTRIDILFYGRYNEALVPTLLSLAVALSFRGIPGRIRGRLFGIASAITLCLGMVVWVRVSHASLRVVSPYIVPGLFPLVANSNQYLRSQDIPLFVTLGAAATMAVMAILTSRSPGAVAAILLCIFVLVGAGDRSAISSITHQTSKAVPTYMALRSLHPAVVAYDLDNMNAWDFYGLPFWLNESRFVAFHGRTASWPGAELFVGPEVWPQATVRGLHLIDVDPVSGQGFWAH